MPSAARAYASAPARAPRRESPIRVLPGGRSESQLSPQVIFIAKAFMIALAVFALVACVRIGLASATVSTSVATEEINATVNDIRSGSAHLEVSESALANPTSMKLIASEQLNMVLPDEVATVVLEPDTVVYDEAGNLSLARSLTLKG